MKKIMSLLILSILLTGCRSHLLMNRKKMEAPLVVKVFNGQNRALLGVTITLTDEEGDTWVQQSDVTGRAFFPPIPFGYYQVQMTGRAMESVEFPLDFLDEGQSIYGRLYSMEELLEQCETAMDRRAWEDARGYLARAEALDEEGKLTLWYRALLHWQLEEYTETLQALDRLKQKDGPIAPEVFLLSADVQQYHLHREEEAIHSLEEYLHRRYDRHSQERLDELRESQEVNING